MKNQKAIEALNSLITINNDRIEGYETAADLTEEQDLKSLFTQFGATSRECKQELVSEVISLGGEEAKGTKASGKFFRVWMDVKAAITGKDRKAILNSCEYGEEKAKDVYDDVMENDLEHLDSKQQILVSTQRTTLKAEHDRIKALHGALVDA